MSLEIRPTWPIPTKEIPFWHGLAVTVEDGVVRLWLVDATRPMMTDTNYKISSRPVLLLEYKTGNRLPQRALPSTRSGRQIEVHLDPQEMELRWLSSEDPNVCENRGLVRTCRLVCRDWAKQIAIGDPKLKIADEIVWYCVEDEWRVLSKRRWAWMFREIEWWMERSRLDRVGRKSIEQCKAWYPKLLPPIDESVQAKGKAQSIMSSLSVTSRQYRTDLEPCIGHRFLQNLRDTNSRELYRTCRLVCRDWARQFPVTDPERGKLWLRKGVMWSWIEGDWRVLPSGYWAWSFQDVEWWAERSCPRLSDCATMGYRCKGWYPKLLRLGDDTIRREHETSMRSLKPLTPATAASLPPELFKYICSAADSESWSCRLVCRYWNKQSTPHIFKHIDIDGSPERIRALWKVRAHPTFRPHVKVINDVPGYGEDSKFPWIHLFTQIYTSTQAVWRDTYDGEARLSLRSIDKKIRSVQFSLPRSVPRSFSRGIRSLDVHRLKFHSIEGLTHLACELPDLEKLQCLMLTFDVLPAELPRRRPRKSRNKLKHVHWTVDPSVEPMPSLAIPMLSPFLSAYDAASFLSDRDVAAFLYLAAPLSGETLISTYDAEGHTRQLDIEFPAELFTCYYRFNESSVYNGGNSTKLTVGIRVDGGVTRSGDYLNHWEKLYPILSRLHPDSLELCTQVVFGFHDQQDVIHFAENVLKHLPSISEHYTVRYSVFLMDGAGWGWCQASLDSEEPRGAPKEILLDVYP